MNRVEPEVVEALLEDKVDGFGLMTLYFAPIRGDSKADFAFSSSKLVARACGRLESSGWVLTKNVRFEPVANPEVLAFILSCLFLLLFSRRLQARPLRL